MFKNPVKTGLFGPVGPHLSHIFNVNPNYSFMKRGAKNGRSKKLFLQKNLRMSPKMSS